MYFLKIMRIRKENMKILAGLFDQMVIRRNADGVSEQPFAGRCREDGAVKVNV